MKVPVLVPKVFNFPFTYDSGFLENLKPGDIVIVPFGKSKEIGVVWDKILIKLIPKAVDKAEPNVIFLSKIRVSKRILVSRPLIIAIAITR